ncbi:S-adenosyl-L-methionine-dependent methyltransferase, partial [Piedraia hortae CBS 480.64]
TATMATFHDHFAATYGAERWEKSLYPALAKPTRHAVLANRYSDGKITGQKVEFPVENCEITCLLDDEFPQPQITNRPLTHWLLDAASVLAAALLDVSAGDKVLDLCAAPGGKSIALSQCLWHAENAASRLVVNESDSKRFARLKRNLKAYLPPRMMQSGLVQFSNLDASNASSLPSATFDKALVDVPCSSERHLIHNDLAAWRPASSKKLAATQVKLLMTALRACKIGAKVLYATCSIEPTENDGVIEKMMTQVEKERKKGAKWKVEVELLQDKALEIWAERTKFGWIVLPDHPAGGRWGPLYFARLSKMV